MADFNSQDYFAGLDTDLEHVETKPAKNVQRFPCEHCGGTGRYSGARVHQERAHCFPCNGRGWFQASRFDRQKARQQSAALKARKIDEAREAMQKQHPETLAFLAEASSKSDFARSLYAQFHERGSLTDGQMRAAENMRAKWQAAREQRQQERQEREQNAPTINLAPIIAAMNTARDNGLKRIKVRLECGELSRAPDHGKNPGAIYFKRGETYLGKITQEGRFLRSRECSDDTERALIEAAADPLASMVAYGRLTGACSCCGRELSDPQSIEAGIGPICARKYGF